MKRTSNTRTVLIPGFTCLFIITALMHAQAAMAPFRSGEEESTAVPLRKRLVVMPINDRISFGMMIPGGSRTVAVSAADAFEYKITAKQGSTLLVGIPTGVECRQTNSSSVSQFTRGEVKKSSTCSICNLTSFMSSASSTGTLHLCGGDDDNEVDICIRFGGTMTIPGNGAPGAYSGEFVITVQYLDD